jgi:N-acetylglucosaminyldiphosphoundecaprenol N-acetyl-beta-D-mannosaminyltransferase
VNSRPPVAGVSGGQKYLGTWRSYFLELSLLSSGEVRVGPLEIPNVGLSQSEGCCRLCRLEFETKVSGVQVLSYTSIPIGPMRIHAINAHDLTQRLLGETRNPKKTHHVVTANAQFYNLAEQREDFRDCVAQAEYVCADGISVVMACKWLGKTAVSRVAGVDLVEHLCANASVFGLSVYFLGGREGSAQMAAEVLAAKYPGFKAAGIFCPPYGFEKDEQSLREVVEDIRRVKPSVVFVALGAPRQELFIHQHIRPLGVPVAIGVGGSFEMIAGRVRRAPRWMQKTGLEWLYRWIQEPRRLANRYLVGNVLFCFYLLRYLIRRDHLKESRVS